jgi:hypothetical protein
VSEAVAVYMRDNPVPQRRRKPRRRQTLASALRQAAKVGASVSGATIEDGKITLTFGEPQPTEASNPWLDELDKVTKQ